MSTSAQFVQRLIAVAAVFQGGAAHAQAAPIDACTLNGKALFGRVQIVESFPDFKVRRVESFADLRVQIVESFPDACGEWQIVESFPDFTVQFVDSFADFDMTEVSSFPGESF